MYLKILYERVDLHIELIEKEVSIIFICNTSLEKCWTFCSNHLPPYVNTHPSIFVPDNKDRVTIDLAHTPTRSVVVDSPFIFL